MAIYDFYIFHREGTCIYYCQWHGKKPPSPSVTEHNCKLMYGLLYSLKSFVLRISPTDGKDQFSSYRTSKYKLNYYETPSGIKFVMTTDLGVGNIKDIMKSIYRKIYVEYLVKNPFIDVSKPVSSELFVSKLDAYVKELPFFEPKQ
ncbi:Trafficking protein particle complex subunit 1 [Trichoplax sp. H2]|uniref:Trafficking protein particle complex subunit n=1 Tax=Trichoplax adhaerens TaxID=10228 RepID=B3SBN1_TRIAD|nr:hypothetical protein TRIADDRAFT_32756 [Trichoplax adhaerens]EDV19892.1 hypothetical protein TRIADDRAFT_32756 [Trichoplax adhaerens]RDD39601.1 Trafficking protein particle complex subunit 1 [Trichoplax sp. H2]|eukprot:XP_002117634.1 hypothetical protein TRIADDRAFT_32756 [Trichoplax adhaerens]